MNQKERLTYIDSARGIAMIIVAAGHLFTYRSVVSCIIFSFHMPLFFILSGYLASEKEEDRTFAEYAGRKIKTILLPFFAFFLLGLVVTLFVPAWRTQLSAGGLASSLYNGQPEVLHMGQIWFLAAFFVVQIPAFFLNKYIIRKRPLLLTAFIACLLIIAAVNLKEMVVALPYERLPFKADSAVMGLAFYLIGILLRKCFGPEKRIRGMAAVLLICAVITFFISWKYNGWVNLAMMQYNDTFCYILAAISGSMLVLFCGWLLRKNRLLIFLGKESLFIFGLHSMGICIYCGILSRINGYDVINGGNLSAAEAAVGTAAVIGITSVFVLVKNALVKSGGIGYVRRKN